MAALTGALIAGGAGTLIELIIKNVLSKGSRRATGATIAKILGREIAPTLAKTAKRRVVRDFKGAAIGGALFGGLDLVAGAAGGEANPEASAEFDRARSFLRPTGDGGNQDFIENGDLESLLLALQQQQPQQQRFV